MKYYTRKSHKNYMLALLILLSSFTFFSCSKESGIEPELEPGQSLGIVTIPNLRDMGGYKTTDGEHYCQRTGISFKPTLRH
jgi:hypothetical protein